jgi:REP element-mobilizing transposase RayT
MTADRGTVPYGWSFRGYLPHADFRRIYQHVTLHLADSVPRSGLADLERQLSALPESTRSTRRRRQIEAWLDAGYGTCILADPAAAGLVQQALHHFDGVRYRLLAWVVMPNHIHALIETLGTWSVARVAGTWKSYTGRRLSAMFHIRQGAERIRIWHREYWDRFIRNKEHFEATIDYIHDNPVAAGLVARAEAWPWSSAIRDRARFELPGEELPNGPAPSDPEGRSSEDGIGEPCQT